MGGESKHGQLKKQHSFKADAQDAKVLKSIERLEAAVAGGKAAVTNFADVVYLARAKMLAKDWILCGNPDKDEQSDSGTWTER